MIFDTHTHYTSSRFADHLDSLLESLPTQNVCGVIDCAVDLQSAQQSLAIGTKYPWFYTAVGIHPQSLIEHDTSTQQQFQGVWQNELAAIESLLQHPRVVAIGECGLDYHWPVPKQAQLEMFRAHLQLAKQHNLPILIHDREAHADTYALLEQYRPRGIVHCYSGSANDAVRLANQGLLLGFGGVLTFPNARKTVEAAAAVPLHSIVLETDCPYLAPVPFRGKENHSGLIIHIAQALAQIRGISTEQVLAATAQNARTLFHIS